MGHFMGKNEENEDARIATFEDLKKSGIENLENLRIIELKIEDLSLNAKIKLQKNEEFWAMKCSLKMIKNVCRPHNKPEIWQSYVTCVNFCEDPHGHMAIATWRY